MGEKRISDNTRTAGHSKQTFIFAFFFFPQRSWFCSFDQHSELKPTVKFCNMRSNLSCGHNTANQTFLAKWRRICDSHQIPTNRKRHVSSITMSSTRLAPPSCNDGGDRRAHTSGMYVKSSWTGFCLSIV